MDDETNDRRRDTTGEPPKGDGARPDMFWMARLRYPANSGECWPILANAILILGNDTVFVGMFGLNRFTGQRVLLRAPPRIEDDAPEIPGPYPRGWTDDEDVSLIQAWFQGAWGRKWTRQTIVDAMIVVARQNSFHPILNWLDELTWDRVPRLDNWLVEAFGAVNEYDPIAQGDQWDARNAYYAAVGSKVLIAAVRRLRQPGIKFDTMMILEGPQRIGKSTAIKVLFGEEWVTDNVPPDLKSRDAQLGLHGKWAVEFAEIEHLVRTEIETIKAFLSTAVDHYRPPYGREFVDVPRTNVLIGTTNSDDYLKDQSGNTRFWPIPCTKAEVAWITENRALLWAEAVHRERKGETLWLDAADLQQEAARFTAGRMKEDVWQPAIARWLDKTEAGRVEARKRLAEAGLDEAGKPVDYKSRKNDEFASREPIFTARVLEFGLIMGKDRMTKASEMRVAAALKMLGWTPLRDQKLPIVEGLEGRERRVSTTTWRMPDDWMAGAEARKPVTDRPEETPEEMPE